MAEQKLKIAIVTNTFPLISETFVISHITGLMDLGHEVDIFAYDKPEDELNQHGDVKKYGLLSRTRYIPRLPEEFKWRFLKSLGVLIRQLFQHPKLILRFFNFRKYKKHEIVNHLLLAENFIKKPYDIIHCHFGPVGKRVSFLKDILINSKFIITFHGYDISKFVNSEGEDVYQSLFDSGDMFLPVSRFWAQELVKLGCSQKKILVHHMGIDTSLFDFIGSKKIDGTIALLSIGRLVEKKGHEFVLRAIASLSKNYQDLKYYIAGDGPLREPLEALVSEFGISRNVEFLGLVNQDKVLELFLRTDIFVLPSVTDKDGDKEGIPVVLMEAMAIGRPVISTYHSGIPELIEHNESGILVQEKDVDAIAENLEILINNPEKCSEIAKKARKVVENEFDKSKLSNRLETTYYKLINNS